MGKLAIPNTDDVIEVTTYGDASDPFIWVRDTVERVVVNSDGSKDLIARRSVRLRGAASYVRMRCNIGEEVSIGSSEEEAEHAADAQCRDRK